MYVRFVGNNDMNEIDIKMVDYGDHRRMYRRMGKEEGQRMDIDFGESPNVLKDKYMDVYVDVFAEVVTTNRFDENVDLSTMYLGKIGMKREDIMKAERKLFHLRTRLCHGNNIEWRGMSNIIGHMCE